MNRGETSDSIPIDLIIEIFSRLPAKSIARFYCVSKLWGSMFHRLYFTELFLTRSSARPRLLFSVERDNELSFYSWPQAHNPYGKSSSSLVVAADFHMKFPLVDTLVSCDYASGLIYLSTYDISVSVICNPNTGQYAILPKLRSYRPSYRFLGFDPIDKQFKVLFIDGHDQPYDVLTLGTGIMRWRKIQCPIDHEPLSKGICINGVLYYIACFIHQTTLHVIVCVDVRSEKFNFIEYGIYGIYGWWYALGYCPSSMTLVNYKGKLGGINCTRNVVKSFELYMWVLEDVEKQEFSHCVYTLPDKEVVDILSLFVVGVTTTGEIVLKVDNYHTTSNLFRVLYFNPESNTVQTVEIQGLGKDSRVWVLVDHVEDLNVNDRKLLKSSIYAPSVKNKRSQRYHYEKAKTTTSGRGTRKGK